MINLIQELNSWGKKFISDDGTWLVGVSAIVADNKDPENQHRVRVVIPSIDENIIFDEWARQIGFCLGNGYGTVFIPPIGSEVVLFGALAQKHHLFYASLYNEEMLTPSELNKDISGIKSAKDLYFIAEQVAKILATDIHIIAEQLAKVQANNIQIEANQANTIKGSNTSIEGTSSLEVSGTTVTVNGDGSVSISGGNVSINGSSVKIQNRTVQNNGMPI